MIQSIIPIFLVEILATLTFFQTPQPWPTCIPLSYEKARSIDMMVKVLERYIGYLQDVLRLHQ